ncbi:MAG: hypothetical protein E4G94_09725 [ANME-2 cluster archaeon]|nr:MAG: hypothetical protein E4G94_09725 [ANME-2 cluster archaeon]
MWNIEKTCATTPIIDTCHFFVSPAVPSPSLYLGAHLDLLRPVLWFGDVKLDVMPVSAGLT